VNLTCAQEQHQENSSSVPSEDRNHPGLTPPSCPDFVVAIKPETDCDVYNSTAAANPLCATFALSTGEYPFAPKMIAGVAQADVAVLVVPVFDSSMLKTPTGSSTLLTMSLQSASKAPLGAATSLAVPAQLQEVEMP
jgi:hypothetical protein